MDHQYRAACTKTMHSDLHAAIARQEIEFWDVSHAPIHDPLCLRVQVCSANAVNNI
jgi:hypothetical protein